MIGAEAGQAGAVACPTAERKAAGARLRWKTVAVGAVVISSNAFGNFYLKVGMSQHAEVLSLSPIAYVKAIFTPWVSLGISLLILWLLSRMTLLSWADLSYVLPVTALGYVLSAILGRVFLDEHVSLWRWTGTCLIVVGTMLVGMTEPNTTKAYDEEVS